MHSSKLLLMDNKSAHKETKDEKYKTHYSTYSKMVTFEKKYLLGVGFTDASEEEVLEFIATGLVRQQEKYYVVTPNPELLVIANSNPSYKKVLNSAKIALPDGIGVMMGAWLMGIPLKQRITGVDFTESLCRYVSKQPITVGFLGAGPNVAEITSECLIKKYPGLKVKIISQELSQVQNGAKVDILFVAFGSPKQEIFIHDNLKLIPARVVIGVGGAFDFISGKVPRAPLILRKLGMEWLFRLLVQPWRIKRQLSLLKFVKLILAEKF